MSKKTTKKIEKKNPEPGDIVKLLCNINSFFNKGDICRITRMSGNSMRPSSCNYTISHVINIKGRNTNMPLQATIRFGEFELKNMDNVALARMVKSQMDSINTKYKEEKKRLSEILEYYENYSCWEDYAAEKLLETIEGKKDKRKALVEFMKSSDLISVKQLTL